MRSQRMKNSKEFPTNSHSATAKEERSEERGEPVGLM